MPQTGILGGTFNPVHMGHLRLAVAAARALNLERVEFMPGSVPPHKPSMGLLPFELRCRLLEAAIENQPCLALSRLEAELPPPSYTWNLIAAWRKRHPGETPLFILGAEDFAQLESWHRGRELIRTTSFAVVPRGQSDEMSFRQMVARLVPGAEVQVFSPREEEAPPPMLVAPLSESTISLYLPLPVLDISASAVRIKWIRNESIRFLTPDPVISLLDAHAAEIREYWSVFR